MEEFGTDQRIIGLSFVLAGTKLQKAPTLAELVVARKNIYELADELDNLIDKVAQTQWEATR